MKKLSLFVTIIHTAFVFAQSINENYIKTTTFNSVGQPVIVNDFMQSLSTTELLSAYSFLGGSGMVSTNNNVLTVNIGSVDYEMRLKLGEIATLNSSSTLPNINLGQFITFTTNMPTGYFAKIENNKLIFYSPYFFNTVDTTLNQSIPGGSTINLTSIPFYNFPPGGFCYGQINIVNGDVTMDLAGFWEQGTSFNLSSITVNLNQIIPDTELGFVKSLGMDTVYKAKIENNQLIFYANEPIPSEPHTALLYYSENISSTNVSNKLVDITYFDGLGKPKQTINVGRGGNQENIYKHMEYDNFGRQVKEYLPFAEINSLDDYYYPNVNPSVNPAALSSFYDTDKYEHTLNYFTEKRYENSMASKLLETASAGNNWAMNNHHTIKFDYSTNTSNEVRKFYVEFLSNNRETPRLRHNGFYYQNELTKFVAKDENWQPTDGLNKTTQEFKDKEGKLILARRFNKYFDTTSNTYIDETLNTYYVYDDFGNLSYVIPPLASDEIDVTAGSSAQSSKTLPWTNLALVDDDLASYYNKLLEEYKNDQIKEADLYNKFGGQGQFTLSNIGNNQLELNINITTLAGMELRTGEIVTLKDLGEFKDTELGRITGEGYEYIFYIKGNALGVTGNGKVKIINTTFSGLTKLVYNMSYPWVSLVDIKSEEEKEYLERFKQVSDDDILTAEIPNNYGAVGGIYVSVDENDNVSVYLDISSTNDLKFKKGLVLPLKIERKLDDKELFVVDDDNYKYRFEIKENSIYIEGEGAFTQISKTIPGTGPPPTVILPQVPAGIISGLCYEYHYDNRNRLIEKRIPGTGWQYFVYDRLDRQVLSQDPNQRINNKWLFKKYDVFNRIAYSGEFKYVTSTGYTNSALRLEVQNLINSTAGSLNENRTLLPFQNHGIFINYTDNVFPKSVDYDVEVFGVNYYDNYEFTPDGINTPTIPSSVYGVSTVLSPKNLLTGSLTRVLNNDDWIVTLSAYDNLKYRTVWVLSENSYLNTRNFVQTKYDFSGKVLETSSTHSKAGFSPNVSTIDKFSYDHASRLLKQTQQINGGQEELIVYNKYDELGRLIQKKVGGQDVIDDYANTTALQIVDISYNVRGMLKRINDPDLSILSTDKLFAFKINYDTPELGATQLFNGNISETSWRTRTDNQVRNYKYSYDDLFRLTQADYVSGIQMQNGQYDEGNIKYDKNGNIIKLERRGLKEDGTTIDVIDKLDYLYLPKSNKLTKVNDSATPFAGFIDINTAANDYAYDPNGNMLSDINKKITKIYYNHLNLPTKVVFDYREPDVSPQPKGIKYVYDASGKKLEKHIVNTPYVGGWLPTIYETISYDGSFVYKNNELQFMSQPEGYVKYDSATNSFSYVYQYKDHLGNVRLSYTDANNSSTIENNEIIEEDNYYAFGMKHRGYNSIINPIGNELGQKYKFGGKEYQDDLGLNNYDFGARNYEPTLGRWMNVDPLSEKYFDTSTYNYVLNNPLRLIDPDGRGAFDIIFRGLNNNEIRILAAGEHQYINLPFNLKSNLTLDLGLGNINPNRFAYGYTYSGSLNWGFGIGAQYGATITVARFSENKYSNYNYVYLGRDLNKTLGVQATLSASAGYNVFVAYNNSDQNTGPGGFAGPSFNINASWDLKEAVGGGINVSVFSGTRDFKDEGWKGISLGFNVGVGESVNMGSLGRQESSSVLLNEVIETSKRSFADRFSNSLKPIESSLFNAGFDYLYDNYFKD